MDRFNPNDKVVDLARFKGKAPTPERLDLVENTIKRLTVTIVQLANAQAALNDQVTRGNLTIEALVHCLLGSKEGEYRASYEEYKKSGKSPDYQDVTGAILVSSKFKKMVEEIAGVWNEQEKHKQEQYAKAAAEAEGPEAENEVEEEPVVEPDEGPESDVDEEPPSPKPFAE
jgi:hypothetical protein